jgi:hypothetical protein
MWRGAKKWEGRKMNKYLVIVGLFATACCCDAQQQAVLGRWSMDPTRSESAAQADPTYNSQLTIKQTATQLSVETRQGSADRILSYNLDGTDTASKFNTDSATGRMKWDNGQLVTDTVFNVKDTAMSQTATYTVSGDGKEMTVDYKMRVLHGYEDNHEDAAKKDPNSSSGKDVYIRR